MDTVDHAIAAFAETGDSLAPTGLANVHGIVEVSYAKACELSRAHKRIVDARAVLVATAVAYRDTHKMRPHPQGVAYDAATPLDSLADEAERVFDAHMAEHQALVHAPPGRGMVGTAIRRIFNEAAHHASEPKVELRTARFLPYHQGDVAQRLAQGTAFAWWLSRSTPNGKLYGLESVDGIDDLRNHVSS